MSPDVLVQKKPFLFAGIDNLSLDTRTFNPSKKDIEHICCFFNIGRLENYKQEKGINVSHSNFYVYVKTTRGEYALKFYPAGTARTIALEYVFNHFLIDQHFPTPLMHADATGCPFFTSNGCLATCFTYIKGHQAWKNIRQRKTIHQINAAMLSLKNILIKTKGCIPFKKQTNLTTTVKTVAQSFGTISSYDNKEIIESSLKDVCRTYQLHQQLFTRQLLHNNASLTNFIINKNKIFTLDLSHIQEDYALSDLASLTISCLFFNVPKTIIKNIVTEYFTQHKMGSKSMLVLSAHIKIGLIKEYLKNIRREKSMGLSKNTSELTQSYLFHLKARKELIISALLSPTIGQV